MLHFFEGFETVGELLGLANQATSRPRIEKRWDSTSAGPVPADDSFFLIDDYLNEGFSVNMGVSSFSGTNFLAWRVPEEKQVAPGPSSPTWIVGARVHIPSTSRTFPILLVLGELGVDPDAIAIEVRVENSNNLVVLRGDALTEIARVNSVFVTDDWVYVEITFRIGDSGDGILEVRIDGTPELSPSPIDTNPALTIAAVEFQFRTSAGSGTVGDFVGYDDIYIQEGGDYTGPAGRVLRRSLAADSAPTNWTPSAGTSHYELVDENGADVSDYLQSNDNEAADMFLHEALPSQGVIFAVKLEAEAINLSGTNGLDVRVDSDGSFAETNHVVDNTGSYEVFEHYSEIDPKTGSSWTKDGVDALRSGIQINQD